MVYDEVTSLTAFLPSTLNLPGVLQTELTDTAMAKGS